MAAAKQTRSAPGSRVDDALCKNVRAIIELEKAAHGRSSRSERLGIVLSGFIGSMRFVLLHLLLFSGWILVNTRAIPGIAAFDPYPFTFLTLCVSLEAIFLSAFLLIGQNRVSRLADERARLDLQINLLAEQESTETLRMLQDLCRHLDVPVGERDSAVSELAQDIAPSQVARAIERENDSKRD